MEYVRLAEAWRGEIVESVHYGVAAVANADGEILHGWGDTSLVTYPRSSLKPLQAIALVETGASRAYGLGPRNLALASASHCGEGIHVELAAEWLEQLGLDEEALACGPEYPHGEEDLHNHIRAGKGKSRIYHNCSGKHCGFLSVAKHMGWETDGYDDLAHPTQQYYLDVMSELLGYDAHKLATGVDHCTLPALALPVGDMAIALARYAAARVSSPARKRAILQLHEAQRSYPEYMSGAATPYVELVRATGGRAIIKGGAEGFLAVYVPDQGLGIALKIADGDSEPRTVRRSSRFAVMLSLMKELKLLDADAEKSLAHHFEVPVTDSAGKTVGRIRPCPRPG